MAQGWSSPDVDARSALPRAPGTGILMGLMRWAARLIDGGALRAALVAVLGAVASLLPAAVAVMRASGGAVWRADAELLRDQALVAVGLGAAPSTVLGQAVALLPLGSLPFRHALGSAFALALACALCWRVGRRLLARAGCSGLLGALLATVATCTVGLSASWQAEATVGGGAMLAICLALAALGLTMGLCVPADAALTPSASRRWLLLAATVGLTLAESLLCGAALLVAVVLSAVTAGRRPARGLLAPAVALVTLLPLALYAPAALRSVSPRSLGDLGRALSVGTLAPLGLAAARKAALVAWLDEVGLVSLVLAAVGLATSLRDERRRSWMTPLVVLVVADLCYPLAGAQALRTDPLAALRALALVAYALAAALGLAAVLRFIAQLRVPLGRPARVLLVVLYTTAAAVACEESAWATDRSRSNGAERWTDAALASLPVGGAVLVHSPAVAWRLWAAQVVAGRRPDVLVVPLPLLRQGLQPAQMRWDVSLAAVGGGAARARQAALAPLQRELALQGRASEYALSLFADARPLYLELDPQAGKRLVAHLSVSGPWLHYAPQPLGRAERALRSPHSLAASGRVVRALHRAAQVDRPSATVVVRTLSQHVTALALAGAGASTGELLDTLDELAPGSAFVTGARLRLAYAERTHRLRRGVDLRDLLRFDGER